VDMGRFIAGELVRGEAPPHIWERLERRGATYKMVH
jgi:hypothetical protein